MHIDVLFRTSFILIMTDPPTKQDPVLDTLNGSNHEPKQAQSSAQDSSKQAQPNPQTTKTDHATKPTPAEAWESFVMQLRRILFQAFWSGVQIKETGDYNNNYGDHF